MSNDELSKLYAYSCSIDNLGIKPDHEHLTKLEKRALEMVEKEMRILPTGSVELPLIWNNIDGQIPKLPNNFPMVYKRQIAQEKKLKNFPDGLVDAFNQNFIQLLNEGYA
jgi:hypothetical protein